jgi:cytochrome c biogenesis protein
MTGDVGPGFSGMGKFVSFFASVRLTIVLLVLIAILATVGTFLPQQEEAASLAARLSPGTIRLMLNLKLFDIYASPLFILLLGLLSVNLIVCSLNRFPTSWKRIHPQPFPPPKGLFAQLDTGHMISLKSKKDEAADAVEALLAKKFGKIAREKANREVFLFFQRGRYCHLGVYAIHLSVLLIIAGAVIGSLFGFEGYVSLAEGQFTSHVEVKGGKEPRHLDFAIRCERFVVEFYENGMPKAYRSDLSFSRDGKVVHQGTVQVNHPLSFGGLRFYQSSYGTAPEGKALLVYSGPRGKSQPQLLTEGARFELPERGASATVLRIEENMMNMGPAVSLRIDSPQGEMKLWIFQHIEEMKRDNPGLLSAMPGLNPGLFQPYLFSLQSVEFPYTTGLQVRDDPGVPFVAAGGFLLIGGLLITFGMSHRRFWLRIDEAGGMARIAVAGKSNRSAAGLADETRHLCDSIREAVQS